MEKEEENYPRKNGKLETDCTRRVKGRMTKKQLRDREGIRNGIITRGSGRRGQVGPIFVVEQSSEVPNQKGSSGCSETTRRDQ